MILEKIEIIESESGIKEEMRMSDLEKLVKAQGLEKEAAEMFAQKRRYIEVDDGDYIRLVWKRETPNY